jgi:hypothetical protein
MRSVVQRISNVTSDGDLNMTAIAAGTCNRCQRDLSDIFEQPEVMLIRFRAGYGSVFGDGNVVTGTLCQYCVQEILGPYLSVQDDDPFRPIIQLKVPRQAFQPWQLETEQCNDALDFSPPSYDGLKALLKDVMDDQSSDDS